LVVWLGRYSPGWIVVVGLDVRPSCSRLVVEEEAPSIEIHHQSHHSMVLLLLVVVVVGIDEIDSRIDDGLQQHPSHRERHRTNDINQSIDVMVQSCATQSSTRHPNHSRVPCCFVTVCPSSGWLGCGVGEASRRSCPS